MIDIDQIFEDNMLVNESCGSRVKHLFEDGDLTFAEIRDILQKVFSGGIKLKEKVDGISLFVTYKDGKFRAAISAKDIKDPMDYERLDAKCCEAPDEMRDAVTNSLKDLSIALSELDPVELNKYFANGQNFLTCRVVYPPAERISDYGNRCFIALDGIKCFNDKFKEVGEDKESADTLFAMLRNNGALSQETFEITKPNILRLKNTVTAKAALEEIMNRLNKFIDGVGWKCSLNQYIQDRYSRHIVNKALEHGIDVSRNSDFVNTLAKRLSQVSGQKPTKSDLVTYAKCDGVNSHTQEYRDFLADLEQNAETTNAEIIKPLEQLILYAAISLMKNVTGFMCLDPSKTAKKTLAELDGCVDRLSEADFELTPEKIQNFKKNLSRIESYREQLPASGIMILYKGRPYQICGDFGPANSMLELIKYK